MRPFPTVVAFTARAGHGKTTCAAVARELFGAHPVSFAGPLKRLAKRIWGLEDRHLYGTQEEKLERLTTVPPTKVGISENFDQAFEEIKKIGEATRHVTPRQLMQDLGTWLRAELYADVWVETAVRQIQDRAKAGENDLFVIDDLRYPNEAEVLLENAGEMDVFIVHVRCTDAPPTAFDDHPSERNVENIGAEYGDATIEWSLKDPVGSLSRKCAATLLGFRIEPTQPICPLCGGTGLKADGVTCCMVGE